MSLVANKPCPYCGNNPVPHFLTWYFESINTLLTPVRKILLNNFASDWLRRQFSRHRWPQKLVSFFAAIKVMSFQDNPESCKVARAQVLWQEALKRGLVFREILLFGRPLDLYWLQKNSQVIVFSGLPRPASATPAAVELLDDKLQLKKNLRRQSLPVPQGDAAWSWYWAKKIFARLPKPVIVKPRTGSRGRHTTTFVYTEAELKTAFKVAKQLCFWVIVEEHLPGPVYRGTVINYKTVGVLRGDSPKVVGDGQKTILQLIENFNRQLPQGIKEIKVTPLTENFLKRQGESLSSVLPFGHAAAVSEKIGVSYGGSSSEDFTVCHPDNLALFEAAAKALGDPLVGFDFIIPDITLSFKAQRCGFIEANSLPFINLHHAPFKGQPQNVAGAVLGMVGF